MSVRERILTIRLMEKVNANPAYADAFGIVVMNRNPVSPGQFRSGPANHKRK